jgi:hypothetical protein
MHTSVGEEGSTPALATVSPVEIEPASAVAGGGGTGYHCGRYGGGGRRIPPPPLAANQRTPQRQQWWWQRQHGGKVGREELSWLSCFFVWLAVLVRVALLLLLCTLVYIPGPTQGCTKPKHSHVNRLTAIRVLAGSKNSRPVGFLL